MSGESETIPNGTGPKRWVRLVLIASLALNLLIVGIVVGAMLSWPKWQRHHPSRLDMVSNPLIRALSREDRREIGMRMHDSLARGGAPHGDLRAELEGLIADLTAEPFDPEAIAARMARHRAIFDARFELGQDLLLKHLTGLQPAERAAYAERLRTAMTQHRHRHGQGHGHGYEQD